LEFTGKLAPFEVHRQETSHQIMTQHQYTVEERARLSKMVIRLFRHWKLDDSRAAVLLGLPTSAALIPYRDGEPFPDDKDTLDRVGNLFGIHTALRTLYPQNRSLVYRWPTTPNKALDGLAPIEIMVKQGHAGIVVVRGYLDHLCQSAQSDRIRHLRKRLLSEWSSNYESASEDHGDGGAGKVGPRT
jgi:hypothetical protein